MLALSTAKLKHSATESLKSGFRAYGLVQFNPNAVYTKMPTENVLSPRIALNETLINASSNMHGWAGEEAESRKSHGSTSVSQRKVS